MRPLISAVFVAAMSSPLAAQTICIDPGHPSENGVGTRGKKLTEVGVAWEVGVAMKTRLTKLGYTVVMTKKSLNEKVTNQKRAEIGNTSKSDLVVRLHCDAGTGQGFAVYYPDKPGKVKGVSGPSASVIKQSAVVAKPFHAQLAASLKGKLKDNGLMSDRKTMIGARQGALTGSIFSKVPVLLVEMCVLQNASDEKFVASKEGRETLVSSLVSAVEKAVPRKK